MSERHHAFRSSRAVLLSLLSLLAVAVLLLTPVQPALAQQAPAGGGPQSSNIFDHPSEGPDTQAERQAKQPGNNAPIWRAVNSTQTHFTTLPDNEGGVVMIFGRRSLTKDDLGKELRYTRFALLPKRLNDGRWVWLEKVQISYRVQKRFPAYGGFCPDWWHPEWERVSVEIVS